MQLAWLIIGFQVFICVYAIIEVVHTEFTKIILTKYSAFKSSGKLIKEQVAAVIIALISEKNKSMKKRKRKKSLCENLA